MSGGFKESAVNRRMFLLGLGATACGARPVKTKPRRPVKPNPEKRVGQEVPLVSWYDTQTQRSPVAIRGDLLVLAAETELWTWDARTMKRVDGYVLPSRHCCFVQDGSLAVFGLRSDSGHSVIHRIDATGIRETLPGEVFGAFDHYPTQVLPARSADQLYVTKDKDVYLMREVNGRMEDAAVVAIPNRNSSNRGQLFSLGDGRLVAPGGGVNILQAGKPAVTYPMPERPLVHMVAATNDRLWYSHTTKHYLAADVLVLAKLATPMVEEQRIQFAPARVVHLASSGRAVAALLFAVREGSSALEPIREWTVVVIDDNGTERWRAVVPKEFTPGMVTLNQVGFLAMSEHRVVLFGERPPIAWDVATGAPIG